MVYGPQCLPNFLHENLGWETSSISKSSELVWEEYSIIGSVFLSPPLDSSVLEETGQTKFNLFILFGCFQINCVS